MEVGKIIAAGTQRLADLQKIRAAIAQAETESAACASALAQLRESLAAEEAALALGEAPSRDRKLAGAIGEMESAAAKIAARRTGLARKLGGVESELQEQRRLADQALAIVAKKVLEDFEEEFLAAIPAFAALLRKGDAVLRGFRAGKARIALWHALHDLEISDPRTGKPLRVLHGLKSDEDKASHALFERYDGLRQDVADFAAAVTATLGGTENKQLNAATPQPEEAAPLAERQAVTRSYHITAI